MARNAFAKKVVDAESVTFNFSNGQTLVADLNPLSEDIRLRLALHGLAQKIGDSYAFGAGEVHTAEEAYSAASAQYSALCAGDWGRVRGAGSDESTLFEEAYLRVNISGIPGVCPARPEFTLADARAKLAEKTDEQKKSLKKLPAIVAAMGEIRVERATAVAAPGAQVSASNLF